MGRLTIQCDELWSFVDNKDNKQGIWLALDADTREIVGAYIGARSEAAARSLWDSLPGVNVQSLTPIFGRLTQRFYQVRGIVQWAA